MAAMFAYSVEACGRGAREPTRRRCANPAGGMDFAGPRMGATGAAMDAVAALPQELHEPRDPNRVSCRSCAEPGATCCRLTSRSHAMTHMRAVQVARAGGPLELVERPVPAPGPGSVRIKVQACGICHSDVMTKDGLWPGVTYPRVPGHEVIGILDAVGKDVPARWNAGQRVGVGWHAWHCGYCDPCRRGSFFACQTGVQVTGISLDGGYADYMIAPSTALALVPAELAAPDAAPLMCAGLTTFNALRNSGARPGDLVAVLGVGGLGHLGVQYAAKMGFRTVAIARGKDKEA